MDEPIPQRKRPYDWLLYQRAIALDRLLRGRETWNAWARELVDRRIRLLSEGKWTEDCMNYDWIDCYWDQAETYFWMYKATIYFNDVSFHMAPWVETFCPLPMVHPVSQRFTEYVTLYETYRDKYEWEGGGPFAFPNAIFPIHVHMPAFDFSYFIFPGNVSFTDVAFHGDVDFSGSTFWMEMEFDRVVVQGHLGMQRCDFLWQFYTRQLTIEGDFILDGVRTIEAVDSFATVKGNFSARGALFNECYCCPALMGDIVLGYDISGDMDLSHAHFFCPEAFLPNEVGGKIRLEHTVFTSRVITQDPDLYIRAMRSDTVFCRGISTTSKQQDDREPG